MFWHRDTSASPMRIRELREQIDQLTADLAEERARLDYLIGTGNRVLPGRENGKITVWVISDVTYTRIGDFHTTPREAIDAAIDAAREGI